ncbi:MAG: hypothetical protein PVJ19_15615, partial [Desulfobacteraceae bacterium]
MRGTDNLPAESLDSINHTILIVYHNPENLDVMADWLSDAGFKVYVARNGETCLELAERVMPSLILLNTVLPG